MIKIKDEIFSNSPEGDLIRRIMKSKEAASLGELSVQDFKNFYSGISTYRKNSDGSIFAEIELFKSFIKGYKRGEKKK